MCHHQSRDASFHLADEHQVESRDLLAGYADARTRRMFDAAMGLCLASKPGLDIKWVVQRHDRRAAAS